MAAAVPALGDAVQTVKGNPITIAMTILAVFAGMVISVPLAFIPIIGSALAQATMGVLTSGVVGAVALGFADGRQTRVSLDGYTQTISDYWQSLFGAYLLSTLLYFLIGLAMLIVMFFVVGIGFSTAAVAGSGSTVAAGGISVITVIAILGMMAVLFGVAMVLQFLDVAVVMGEYSATEAFSESLSIVTENPVSVLGYTILRGSVVFGVIVLLLGLSMMAGYINEGLAALVFIAGGLVLGPIAAALFYAHHAHYYRRLNRA